MNKKIKIVIGCFLVIFVFGFIAYRSIMHSTNQVKLQGVDLTTIQDGSYTGSYTINPVTVKVQVAVENHHITSVKLLKHMQGLGTSAETLIETIVDKQRVDIDTVSGATVSSKCILKASERALLKGQ